MTLLLSPGRKWTQSKPQPSFDSSPIQKTKSAATKHRRQSSDETHKAKRFKLIRTAMTTIRRWWFLVVGAISFLFLLLLSSSRFVIKNVEADNTDNDNGNDRVCTNDPNDDKDSGDTADTEACRTQLTDDNDEHDDEKEDGDDDDVCGLYLAPSSIPGAGLGVYTGSRRFDREEFLAEPDIGVPIFNVELHHGEDEYDWLWWDYIWQHGVYTELKWEAFNAEEELDAVTFGIGAAVNYIVPLVNVADHMPSRALIDRAGITSRSPGDGAISPYYGRRFMAGREIEPYSELFAYYGENYFLDREYDDVPLSADYTSADHIMTNYINAFEKWLDHFPMFSGSDLQRDLWDLIVDPFEVFNLRIRNALPSGKTVEELKTIMAVGGASWIPHNATIRNKEWMKANGKCMDNIRPGISNIPHAGRGAFAARSILKGGLVSPSPLVHIPYRSAMQIYQEISNSDPTQHYYVRNVSAPVHQQLILNYCWGSSISTLLLCPYGQYTNLINHDTRDPNTKIVWSDKMRNEEWLKQPIREWGHEGHSGLSFDYVAIRDIAEGEEITVDYGKEWEDAWQEHVRTFESSVPRPNYIPDYEWNNFEEIELPPIPTVSDPPERQLIGVLLSIKEEYLPQDHGIKQFRIGIQEEEKSGRNFFLCRVVERQENGMYIVQVFERPDGLFYDFSMDTVKLILHDIPREAFFFQNVPFSRSHYQYWSFRHDMRIPDEMLPDAWKNIERVFHT